MGIKIVDTLPKCDFKNDYPHPNGDNALYDAPTIPTGTWANMCKACALSRGNMRLATKFELRKKYEGEIPKGIQRAIEPGLDDLDYWEKVYIDDEAREPKCPVCKEIRRIESDAENYKHEDGQVYGFECSGCKTKVSISSGVM